MTEPIDGSPAEKAGVLTGDIVRRSMALRRRADGRRAPATRSAARRGPSSVVGSSAGRGADLGLDHPRRRPDQGGREQGAGRRHRRLHPARRVLRRGRRPGRRGAARTHLAAGRTKLILDLRGNPGGYVTAARKIASQFIGSGVVFWEQDAQGNQTPTNALADGVATDPALQLVVLVDGGSASASEIVAGALQDTKRATLVGQQSFGKGTVQQWQELTGEGGAFKLTIARWLTPDKRWIHKVGLTPDVVVTLPKPVPAGTDPDLDKALEVLGARGPGSLAAHRGLRSCDRIRSCARLAHRVRFRGTKGGDVQ